MTNISRFMPVKDLWSAVGNHAGFPETFINYFTHLDRIRKTVYYWIKCRLNWAYKNFSYQKITPSSLIIMFLIFISNWIEARIKYTLYYSGCKENKGISLASLLCNPFVNCRHLHWSLDDKAMLICRITSSSVVCQDSCLWLSYVFQENILA